MEKRYQIFISSTYADLIDERKEIMEAILSLNCFPAGMEMFPATNMEQFEYIKKVIDMSDYYVLVIAGRYGSLAKDGISYTEKEYNYAKRKKIPILAFIYEDIEKLPLSKVDKNMDKLEKFRNKVKRNRVVKFWSNASELKYMIHDSLLSEFELNPREGWIKNYQPQTQYKNLENNKKNEYIIPSNLKYPLSFEAFMENREVKRYINDNKRYIPVGINIQNNDLACLDMSNIFCFGIAGRFNTGKTNILKIILSILQIRGEECYVIDLDKTKQVFKNIVSTNNYLNSYEMIFNFFEALLPQIKERNVFKKECIDKNYTDAKIYDEMNKKFSRINIFIDNVTEFIKIVYERHNLSAFLENIIDKGKLHNVYFFFGYDTDSFSEIAGRKLYNLFIDSNVLLHLGGNVAGQRVFDASSINYTLQTKRFKTGIGLLRCFEEEDDTIFANDIKTFCVLIPKINL